MNKQRRLVSILAGVMAAIMLLSLLVGIQIGRASCRERV